MIKKPFETIDILKYALNGSNKRNQAISNNIANVNTPNYKREYVNFEDTLKEQVNFINKKTRLMVTHEKHFDMNGQVNKNNIKITKDKTFKTKKDGNNVNIDMEMASLAKNTIMYNAMVKQVSSELNKIKSVINDGR